MNKKIIIENNTSHNGKSHRRPFACQVFESGNKRTYVLYETKRDVINRFNDNPHCFIMPLVPGTVVMLLVLSTFCLLST